MSPENRNGPEDLYKWLIRTHRERAEQFLRGKAGAVAGVAEEAAAVAGQRLARAADSLEGFLRRTSGQATRGRRRITAADGEGRELGRYEQARADVGDVLPRRREQPPVAGAERAGGRAASAKVGLENSAAREAARSARARELGVPEDPKAMAELWSQFSRDDKLSLWSRYRDLGNHDGIPHAERNTLNRLNLEVMRADAFKLRSEALEAGKAAKVAELDAKIAAVDRVSNAIGYEDDRFLVYLDDDLNTVVSDKNMDLAKYKVTYVVGAGKGPIGSAAMTDKLTQAALREDPTAEVATARWQAYLRPDGGVEIQDPAFAEAAAPALRRFQEGLVVTHKGPENPLMTVIGHSYGARVVGEAARADAVGEEGLHAWNLAFTGSFGTGVNNVRDFRLAGVSSEHNSEHVFATMKKYDPFRVWTGEHGRKPTDREFGAVVFASPSQRGPVSRLGFNAQEHWGYYYEDEGRSTNPTLQGLGRIITGQVNRIHGGGEW